MLGFYPSTLHFFVGTVSSLSLKAVRNILNLFRFPYQTTLLIDPQDSIRLPYKTDECKFLRAANSGVFIGEHN